jgi:hypothetical protein
MKNSIIPWFLACTLIILLFASTCPCFDINPYRPVLERAVDLTVRQQYDSVLSIFDSIITEKPGSPVGYYFKMMTLEARMIDYENIDGEKDFLELYKKSNSLLDSLLAVSQEPWYLYFKGATFVSYGLHMLRFSEYFRGTKKLLGGVDYLEESFNKDSTIVDALLYISLYKYAKHQIGEIFSWLAFWSKKTDGKSQSRCLRACIPAKRSILLQRPWR